MRLTYQQRQLWSVKPLCAKPLRRPAMADSRWMRKHGWCWMPINATNARIGQLFNKIPHLLIVNSVPFHVLIDAEFDVRSPRTYTRRRIILPHCMYDLLPASLSGHLDEDAFVIVPMLADGPGSPGWLRVLADEALTRER